jgi:predicted MFS family arabinose efflux permease
MKRTSSSIVLPVILFLCIFSSIALDSGIIPLFETVAGTYGRTKESGLTLISVFNALLVVGLLAGTWISAISSSVPILIGLSLVSTVGAIGAIVTTSFQCAVVSWGILGLCAGILANLSWEISLDPRRTKAEIANMVSAQIAARPIALAVGVPAFAFLTSILNWRFALFFFALTNAGLTISLALRLHREGLLSSLQKVH